MPIFFIRLRNADFESADSGADYDHPEAALTAGIAGALGIAGDEIAAGKPSAAVQIYIDDDQHQPVLRSVVSTSVSPLWIGN